MSKHPISAKITLNHFQLPGFKSTKKQASSIDKRLSIVFITKIRSAFTNRREYVKLLFSSEIYDYCQILSEDDFDLYHGAKSNILNLFQQVTNNTEISSSAVLLTENSPIFRSDIWRIRSTIATHVLITFVNGISTIVGKIWLETNEIMTLSYYLMIRHHKGESILSNSTLDESISISTAKEQNLVPHMIHCMRGVVKQCLVRTVDTDVVISLIAYRRLDCAVFASVSRTVSSK